MTFQKTIFQLIIASTIILYTSSCVKDGMPPDCKKPAKPSLTNANVSAKEGDSIQLHASGPSGAQYLWSGPNGFYSTSANPSLSNITIANNGQYWVKTLVGYCYSDSVAETVTVISDTTCSLGDNAAVFPNGSAGPFRILSSCNIGSNGSYSISSSNADSSVFVTVTFNSKPTKGSVYTITNNTNPPSGQVFIQLKDQYGVKYSNVNGVAYVKVSSTKLNVVICQVKFENIGVFSANMACQ